MPDFPRSRALSSLVWMISPLILGMATSAGAAGAKPAPATVVPGAEQVRSTTLANGMKIIVWTDRDIPNVALYNWVRVGSRNEVPGITGLAHFFEHMMFNGSSKRQPGEFDRLLESQGGSNNAFTTDNVTVYQDWVPRSALDLTFDLSQARFHTADNNASGGMDALDFEVGHMVKVRTKLALLKGKKTTCGAAEELALSARAVHNRTTPQVDEEEADEVEEPDVDEPEGDQGEDVDDVEEPGDVEDPVEDVDEPDEI